MAADGDGQGNSIGIRKRHFIRLGARRRVTDRQTDRQPASTVSRHCTVSAVETWPATPAMCDVSEETPASLSHFVH